MTLDAAAAAGPFEEEFVDAGAADVEAAGCVVARPAAGGAGGPELLLVHRPAAVGRGADWGWPKGKVEPGEHPTTAAVRETEEETGVRTHLGPPVRPQRYDLPDGRTKRVRYWLARLQPGESASTPFPDEVDEVAWCSPERARELLTYPADVEVLEEALALGPLRPTWPLVVLRHAKAVKRADWDGAEADRPLLDRGHAQARDLAPVLASFDLRRIVSSPWSRCLQTVLPLAELTGLPVLEEDGLTEAAHVQDPDAGAAVLRGLLALGGGSVVCSHGPVLPGLLELTAGHDEDPARREAELLPKLAKGELVVAHVAGHGEGAVVVAAERHRA